MKQYFLLQLKRCLRYLPAVLCIALLLFGGAAALLSGWLSPGNAENSKQKVTVGLVGTGEDTLMQTVLAALKNFDSTRFSVAIQAMEETDARKALTQGQIEAYVVFPEEFMDKIMYGQVTTVEYVSLSSAPDLASILAHELTAVITDLLTDAQKGIYGAGAAMHGNGHGSQANQMIYDISLEYVLMVLQRDQVYRVQTLDASGGLGMEGTLLGGLIVTSLFLLTLPFAPVFVKDDYALERMLAAKGLGTTGQILCQTGAYLCVMLTAFLPVVFGLYLLPASMWSTLNGIGGLLRLIPVILLVVAMSLMLYEATSDLISGVILNFFTSLFLCFVGGCMYPVWFFPEVVQRSTPWLPTGMARDYLFCLMEEKQSAIYALGLVGYSALFCLMAVLLRRAKQGRGLLRG